MDSLRKRKSFLHMGRTAEKGASEGSGASRVLDDPDSTVLSTPASLDNHGRSISLGSIRSVARRSISGRSSRADSSPASTRPPSRKLTKSARTPFTAISASEPPAASSDTSWAAQKIEGSIALQPESHSMLSKIRSRQPYLVVTSENVVKLKSQSDATCLFPHLAESGSGCTSNRSAVEPVVVIPIQSIVAIYHGEDSLPAFSFEIWWRNQACLSYKHTTFCFNLPSERDLHMRIIRQLLAKSKEGALGWFRGQAELERHVESIREREEVEALFVEQQVFPVVPRGKTREEWGMKNEEHPKNIHDAPGFYLVVGAHFCFLCVRVQKAEKTTYTHKSFGLVALDRLEGSWKPHEERFILSFCQPFEHPVRLELASRFWRNIIRAISRMDMFLKPTWPILWQECELFSDVDGFSAPQEYVPRDDFGSVQRTLDAYLKAYGCDPVDWEINWRKQHSPEFRLVPPKSGRYSRLQLLAVLRALRYNDFFHSLCFRDVDLSILWNWCDSAGKTTKIGYMDRGGLLLHDDERRELTVCPVLCQEIHALAFCSGAIRQIDFTNSFVKPPPVKTGNDNFSSCHIQFLLPILALLRSSATKCHHLILAGNALTPTDIFELGETLKTGTIRGLDLASCGLDDGDVRLLATAISRRGETIQTLNLSGNPGRLAADTIPTMMDAFSHLQELNLCGAIQGTLAGPLVSFEALCRLKHLRELDLTHFKLDEATLAELEKFLRYRGWEMDDGKPSEFHRLVLVNCEITGAQAGKLFNAIEQDHGVHLLLSRNPIEQGIESLVDAIRNNRGPAGLNLEMVEFRTESNFASLINALADTKFMSLLSLVGTAPSVTVDRKCSDEVMAAFENFFSNNTSVSYLDISGFRGRLEEGQFGKGFGRCLLGLRKNTTMTYLRVRNQNLNLPEDVGVLGDVIAENQTLQTFDCQDNGFSMTSLQFLVNSLKENHTITDFPISAGERDQIWQNVLAGTRGDALPAAVSASPSSAVNEKPLHEQEESLLRGLFEHILTELDDYLSRNRNAQQRRKSQILSFDDASYLGNRLQHGPEGGQSPATNSVPLSKTATAHVRETIRGSAIAVDTSVPTSHQLRKREGLGSPAGTVEISISGVSTPSDFSSPATLGDMELQGHDVGDEPRRGGLGLELP